MYSIQFSTCIYFLKWKHLLFIVRVMFQMKVFKTLYVSVPQHQELKCFVNALNVAGNTSPSSRYLLPITLHNTRLSALSIKKK